MRVVRGTNRHIAALQRHAEHRAVGGELQLAARLQGECRCGMNGSRPAEGHRMRAWCARASCIGQGRGQGRGRALACVDVFSMATRVSVDPTSQCHPSPVPEPPPPYSSSSAHRMLSPSSSRTSQPAVRTWFGVEVGVRFGRGREVGVG